MPNPLLKKIVQQISSNGPITLFDYITTSLTDKDYGYYTTKANILNKGGDFTTSPEISNMFNEVSLFTSLLAYGPASLFKKLRKPIAAKKLRS